MLKHLSLLNSPDGGWRSSVIIISLKAYLFTAYPIWDELVLATEPSKLCRYRLLYYDLYSLFAITDVQLLQIRPFEVRD